MTRGCSVLGVLCAVALCPATAGAQTFFYTGGEQMFVVPPGQTAVEVVASGASGGGPSSGLSGGRGAVVFGLLKVTPGKVLYVEVGATGGQPTGGFNGGGAGGTAFPGFSAWGGGGASDVRLVSSSASGSLASRLIVAAGGGGSADPAAAGGDAGAPGMSNGSSTGGGAGTLTTGGAGGCGPSGIGCGGGGSLGLGGLGGSSGVAGQPRVGGGGGSGLFGGGGGAGNAIDGVGGGGGGSSLVPPNGVMTLAPLATPPSVVVTGLVPAGGNARPVKGTGAGTNTFDFSTFDGTTQIAGQLSQLGASTGSSAYHLTVTSFSPPLVAYDVAGTATFVAANGDELFGTLSGTGTDNNGVSSGVNVVTVTGGTGRFADATGTLVEPYTISASGAITLTIQGQIS